MTPIGGVTTPLQYDSMNRLIQAGNTTYKYDAENCRVGLSIDGVDKRFVINPNSALDQLLVEADSSDNVTKRYVYGLGLLLEEDTTGNYSTYHFDKRGSTIALTDGSSIVTDIFNYLPFGELLDHQGNSDTSFKYNGRDGVVTDANGLYYMRARYYNPNIKRFVNQDILLGSIDDSTSLNRFAYVSGRPLDMIDPFGLREHNSSFDKWKYYQKTNANQTFRIYTYSTDKYRGVRFVDDHYVIGDYDVRPYGKCEANLNYLYGISGAIEIDRNSADIIYKDSVGSLGNSASATIGIDVTHKNFKATEYYEHGVSGGAGLYGGVSYKVDPKTKRVGAYSLNGGVGVGTTIESLPQISDLGITKTREFKKLEFKY